ncbi:MAG TPA: caspase family protein, partial [Humibacillus sp.]|nr:caspase family protein [Humibacillus sp.]
MRVRTPGGYDATEARDRGDRDLGDGTGRTAAKSALLAALAEQDFDVVDRVDLTPRRSRDLGSPGPANRRATVSLDVDVAPGDDAVVLLERDGVYSWHLPLRPTGGTRSIDPRTLTFEIEVQPRRPTSAAARASRRSRALGAEQPRDRGLLGDLVHGAVQAIVLRFAVPFVVGHVVRKLEEPVRPGLVHVAGPGAATWQPVGNGTLSLPKDRPARVLLLVHGTFSSTVGAFAPMGLVPGAEGFLPTVLAAYDAVIGYDHRTLSVDPRHNADDMLAELRRLHPGTDLTIDIITHSRGGLVTRSFVEAVLPQSNWPASVDHIVFVASTHGGTHLADPARWHDLVDLYTNLITVGAAGLAVIPGGGPVAAVVSGVVRGIGALVKYLVSYAAEGDDVPGLAAMMPGGPFVTELNGEQPGQPAPGTNWHVVSSNFHVSLLDGSHRPPEFPKELAVRLGEGFVDGLFEGDNDLVVDTASMSAIGPASGGYVKDSLAFGTNDEVYHTNYFGQLRVIEAIRGWLPLERSAGALEEGVEAPAEGPVQREVPAGDDQGLPVAVQPAAPPATPPVRKPAKHQPSVTERGRVMTSRALCVGINEFKSLPQSSWLNGCVNDADDIAAVLKKNGFQARNVTVLHDAEATKEAIMTALTGMLRKSKPGDEVLFSYSSHGTQVPNLPGTEAAGDEEYDGLDEAFACYEIAVGTEGWDRDTVIVDDELRELFASAPEGVLVEVLLDTCHSGSGTRDLDDIQRDLLRGRRPRYLPPPTAKALAKAREI